MEQLKPKYKQVLVDIAKRNRLAVLAVFGSYARGKAKAGSDIDLFVRFGRSVSLFDVLALQYEIEDSLHIPVDLIAEEAMIPHSFVRNGMEQDLVVLYADIRHDHAIAE